MYKIRFIVLIISLFAITTFIVYANKDNKHNNYTNTNKMPLIGQEVYNSNRYTQMEDFKLRDDDNNIEVTSTGIVTNYTVKLNENDKYIAGNDFLLLYYNEKNHTIKFKNQQTGYLWSSNFEELSPANSELIIEKLTSIVYIQYYAFNKSSQKISNELSEAYSNGIYTKDEEGKNRRSPMAIINTEQIDNGIKLAINFERAQISFDLYVFLDRDNIVVHIPNDSIIEGNSLLASITVFPTFGATYKDNIPGYIIIPDGLGALYRYKNNDGKFVTPYNEKYYGVNAGIRNQQTNGFSTLSFPFFANIHGVNQDGYFVHIVEGAYNALLSFNPAGASNLNYNIIHNRFIFREDFIFPTSLKGDGIVEKERNKNSENITMIYKLVSGNEANYVGVAKKYRELLIDQGIFSVNEPNYQIHLEFMLSESEKSIFGMKTTVVTTLDDVRSIVNDIDTIDHNRLILTLKGWNNGGLSGNSPYKVEFNKKLGGKKAFTQLISALDDIEIQFYTDYVKTYENAKRISPSKDIAVGYHNLQIMNIKEDYLIDKEYYLYPHVSFELSREDVKLFKKNNITSIVTDTIGNFLFSYTYKSTEFKRIDAALIYRNMLNDLSDNNIKTSVYKPNFYLWEFVQNYYDFPIYNSQFTFYDDTIPLLSIILRGTIECFTPYINLLSDYQDIILLMIDYGINPSFILTKLPSYKLKFTNSKDLYSTRYEDWSEDIKHIDNILSSTLKLVDGALISERTVLIPGVVQTTYDNGVSFILNYTNEYVVINNYEIAPKDYVIAKDVL